MKEDLYFEAEASCNNPCHIEDIWSVTFLRTFGGGRPPTRTIVFVVIGCPVRLLGLHPVLPPHPAAPAHGCSREPTETRRRGYEASRSCSWPFSVRVVEEDMLVPATLRLSWQEESRSEILDNQGP
jgi:hypothetical protein